MSLLLKSLLETVVGEFQFNSISENTDEGKVESTLGEGSSEGSSNGDTEAPKRKLRYPMAVPFIILNELCERFNYYGMRSE